MKFDKSFLDPITSKLSANNFPVSISGTSGSSPAFILYNLFKLTRRSLLVVTEDQEQADAIYAELRFFSGDDRSILEFPAWDSSPMEPAHPHPEIAGKRIMTLASLASRRAAVVVAPLASIVQRVIPCKVLDSVAELIMAGEESPMEDLAEKLLKLGYNHTPVVEDKGTFTRRGGILDIFPSDAQSPFRLEYFGDLVESIRTFDPETQRSLHQLEELVILPGRELVVTPEILEKFPQRLKVRCDDLEIPADKRRAYLEEVQNGIYPIGIELLQPLFYGKLETVFDYIGENGMTVTIDYSAVTEAYTGWLSERDHSEMRALEREQIIPLKDDLYIEEENVRKILETGHIRFEKLQIESENAIPVTLRIAGNSDLLISQGAADEILKPLAEKIDGWLADDYKVAVVCRQKHQGDRLAGLLEPYRIRCEWVEETFSDWHPGKFLTLLKGDISRGFRSNELKLCVVAEEEIFGVRVKRKGVSAARQKQILSSLAELKPGDYMVHVDFGVGIYRGLQHLKAGDAEGDFLLLEYAGADRLYLPVTKLNLVQKYTGAEAAEPRVDKLGGPGWEKAKAKAKAAVAEMAEELLKIYAERQLHEGHSFSPPDDMYKEFEAEFKYEETRDQLSAIEDVISDMISEKPMDRLVCGDVGYGKTEVAMRSAFKAVLDAKQVAVLVPTTVLAQQHFETFTERFRNYPVKIEMLSRFRSPQEQKKILLDASKGEIDIIIGTHRLLQADVSFKDLGLLIVDEEQRFGVAHKEKLKKIRATVDLLTLTATPIPRTLNMAMMGIRDLSIIDTPPVDRLSVKTLVSRYSEDLIREVVMRELRRGGQVFFVHNRVQTIDAMAEHLRQIVPEAKISVGHGQMDEKKLEKVMMGFMHGESNLLLCSTIIESGLDIPNANTLIVNRADTFGLSQLYQIRGRVGRSKQRAYAYFLLPGEGAVTQDARDRLKILQDLSDLGAGFRIASHDLELRGAGDLLGGRQTGQIAAVGFELYTELLEEAINKLKGEETDLRFEPEIKIGIPAFIPEDYVMDTNQRLLLYKKLAQASEDSDFGDVASEMEDRFGKIPDSARYLLKIMSIRILLKQLLITEIEYSGRNLMFTFHPKTGVSPDTILKMIRNRPKTHQFTPDFKLIVSFSETSFDRIIDKVSKICIELSA